MVENLCPVLISPNKYNVREVIEGYIVLHVNIGIGLAYLRFG